MNCKARREQDEKVCSRCGLRWAVDDVARPRCLTSRQIGEKCLKELKQLLALPETLR